MTTARFDNSYARLPERFFSRVQPARVPAPALLAWNAPLAQELGFGHLQDPDEIASMFSGNELPTGADPIALAYAGHQFGQFVPRLGDGRAVLMGELLTSDGRRFDIQLKGSGRTEFSRGGDGKSWIGPVIREYLLSEAMHRLGVPTTRALAAVWTGEDVLRERPLPGGVLARVAASHIRVGSFQYLAAREDVEGVRDLANYAIARHYPRAAEADRPVLALFTQVVARQAALIADWMAVGFVHGVMNTDNTSIAGETIDFGPCAFLDEFRADKVFSSIDRRGRYAYGRQAAIAQWNLARLADCLLMIDDDQKSFEVELGRFTGLFESRYLAHMRRKLGLLTADSGDAALVGEWLNHIQEQELDYTRSHRVLAERVAADDNSVFGEFEERWRARLALQPHNGQETEASMNAVNPLVIPRNHQVERAIEAAVAGDTSVFEDFHQALQNPFEPGAASTHYSAPPKREERVTQTFCGT